MKLFTITSSWEAKTRDARGQDRSFLAWVPSRDNHYSAMSKSLKKKNHWTNKVYESVLCRNKEGELGFELKGGAENGQFPYLGEVKQDKVACQSGRLSQDELLLEVNETPVAGLTIRDVHAVVRHSKDPVRLKCVKQGE